MFVEGKITNPSNYKFTMDLGFLIPILVPLGICVALPVLIVWLVTRAYINSDNKRAAVLIEAIKANSGLDSDALIKAFAKPKKNPIELLNARLLRGCMFSLIGLAVTVISIVLLAGNNNNEVATLLLIAGSVCLSIGVSFLVVYFMTRKQVKQTADIQQ